MKYTKDVMRNQPSDAFILQLVTEIKNVFRPTHIAISTPLDAHADYPDPKPSARTAEAFTQKWCDTIHNAGLGVIHRGAWCATEEEGSSGVGIYDFPLKVGINRISPGNSSSTTTATWCGKTYRYIVDNATFFQSGDIWAPMPEQTNCQSNRCIFTDSKSFLADSGGGVALDYATFFNDLYDASSAAFSAIGKTGIVLGHTTNNYSEISSGWIQQSLLDKAGIIAVDYYGNYNSDGYTAQQMYDDMTAIYVSKGKQIGHQEWGDYYNSSLTTEQRFLYLIKMFDKMTQMVNEGKYVLFNYWGTWDTVGKPEGIMYYDAQNNLRVNGRGKILATYFNGGSLSRIPVTDSNGNY